jgi:hypothetical protein
MATRPRQFTDAVSLQHVRVDPRHSALAKPMASQRAVTAASRCAHLSGTDDGGTAPTPIAEPVCEIAAHLAGAGSGAGAHARSEMCAPAVRGLAVHRRDRTAHQIPVVTRRAI